MTVIWQQPNFMFWLLGLKKEQDDCLAVLHKFSRETIKERQRLYREAKKHQQECTEEQQLLGVCFHGIHKSAAVAFFFFFFIIIGFYKLMVVVTVDRLGQYS